MTTKQRVAAVLLAAAASVWAVPVRAQVTTGTIMGTVSDNTGAAPANIGSPTVGRITTTVGDNRQMQFAAKVDW